MHRVPNYISITGQLYSSTFGVHLLSYSKMAILKKYLFHALCHTFPWWPVFFLTKFWKVWTRRLWPRGLWSCSLSSLSSLDETLLAFQVTWKINVTKISLKLVQKWQRYTIHHFFGFCLGLYLVTLQGHMAFLCKVSQTRFLAAVFRFILKELRESHLLALQLSDFPWFP